MILDDLMGAEPPSRRAALEIELEKAQRGPLYSALGLPTVRVSPRLPLDVLESLVSLQRELWRRMEEQAATPEEARRANTELRGEMRARNNHYPEIEAEAQGLLDAVIAECSGRAVSDVDPAVLDALRLGVYQLLRTRIPAHAAVASTVDMVRERAGSKLAGFANAVLRRAGDSSTQIARTMTGN